MNEKHNTQISTAYQAQQAIRSLLAGNLPGDIPPDSCGKWSAVVGKATETYKKEGSAAAQQYIMQQSAQDDELLFLVCGGNVEDLPSLPELLSIDLGDERKLVSWAEMAEVYGSIEWAWYPWIANGFVTMLAGESGAGKSIFALNGLIRPYLTGGAWPDGTEFTGETGSVLWIETEAGQAMNIQRAKSFNLPLERLVSIQTGDSFDSVIDDDAFRQAVLQVAQDDNIKLIVIDSLSAGHSRDENSKAMIDVLKPWAVLSAATKKPVLIVHHFNRLIVPPGQVPTLRNVRGHGSILQTARVILSVDVPEKEHPEIMRLAMLKNNPSPERLAPLTYRHRDTGIELVDLPETTTAPRLTKQQQAEKFLIDLLANGPVPSSEMNNRLQDAGLLDAAKKVKTQVGVVSTYIDGIPHWSLEAVSL